MFSYPSLVLLIPISYPFHTSSVAHLTPTFGHKVGHLVAIFLPNEVLRLKFRTAHICSKSVKKRPNEGFMHLF